MKSGVTLAMIVRDEADKLRRCLESVADVVDRMVIVDTGSLDDAPEVALEFGAELHRIEWPNAFDIARNFVFDKVKTQWTLWLDSDEWMESESKEEFREILKDWRYFAVRLIRLDMNKHGSHNEVRLTRLWRTHPAMRVTGVIHENFQVEAYDRASNGRQVLDSGVRIWHDGYLGFSGTEKFERNLRLLEVQVENNPGEFYWRAHLMQMRAAKDPTNFVGLIELAVEVVDTWPTLIEVPIALSVVANSVHALADRLPDYEHLEKLLEFCETAGRRSPQPMWEAARARFMRGEYKRAWENLKLIERMGKTGDFERFNSYSGEIFTKKLYENLALCEHKMTET